MQKPKPSGGCLPTPEDTLLLKACLLDSRTTIDLWEQWKSLCSLERIDVASFKLLPLLYRNLKLAGYAGDDLQLMAGAYRRNWYHNQTLFHAITQVLQLFHRAGIPTLLLKGAALAHVYYPDPTLRCMDDGDILVPVQQADHAMELLKNNGWRHTIALKKNHLHTSHGTLFANDKGQYIDLHWHVFHDCLNEEDETLLWQRSVPMDFKGEATRTLSASDHLLHTCIHGYQWNYLKPIRWVTDAWFIHNQSAAMIDWDYVVTEAIRRRYSLRFASSLSYLQSEWKLAVPDHAIEALQAAPCSAFEMYEHHILTHLDRPKNPLLRMLKQIKWELTKVHCLQQRLHPGQPWLQRMVAYPTMLSNEMRLKSPWHFPVAAIQYLCRAS